MIISINATYIIIQLNILNTADILCTVPSKTYKFVYLKFYI